jgi:hypothetical protein
MPDPIAPDATPDEPEIDPEVDPTPDPDAPAPDDSLGDAGKKALDAMKAKWKAAEKSDKEARAELAKRIAADAIKDKPADEQALETARAEARAEAAKAANVRIVKSELRLAAKGVLADPADALAFINLDDFDVNEDGDVDADALSEAISDLIARKPHLAAGAPRKFEGGADQGPKGKSAKQAQITRAELDTMSVDQINTARAAGRLNTVLGIKP